MARAKWTKEELNAEKMKNNNRKRRSRALEKWANAAFTRANAVMEALGRGSLPPPSEFYVDKRILECGMAAKTAAAEARSAAVEAYKNDPNKSTVFVEKFRRRRE